MRMFISFRSIRYRTSSRLLNWFVRAQSSWCDAMCIFLCVCVCWHVANVGDVLSSCCIVWLNRNDFIWWIHVSCIGNVNTIWRQHALWSLVRAPAPDASLRRPQKSINSEDDYESCLCVAMFCSYRNRYWRLTHIKCVVRTKWAISTHVSIVFISWWCDDVPTSFPFFITRDVNQIYLRHSIVIKVASSLLSTTSASTQPQQHSTVLRVATFTFFSFVFRSSLVRCCACIHLFFFHSSSLHAMKDTHSPLESHRHVCVVLRWISNATKTFCSKLYIFRGKWQCKWC